MLQFFFNKTTETKYLRIIIQPSFAFFFLFQFGRFFIYYVIIKVTIISINFLKFVFPRL